MGEELFFGPTAAILGTFCVLNAIYFCLGVRRIRRVEQRVHALENVQISTSTTQTRQAEPVQPPLATPYSPPLSYIRPATYVNPAASTYTYYQQPTAPTYYPQDPQSLYK